MRESALAMAHQKLDEARTEVLAQKGRLETKTGLLNSFSSKGNNEREVQTLVNHKLHYDSQIKKAESLTALINKETNRWLECCLKTGAPDYAAALAGHDYPEDWARFSYGFEMLIKSFQMGLQDIMVQFKRDNPAASRSQLQTDSIRKLLPVARQIEIDVEFFNRILTQQSQQRRTGSGKVTLQPEYSWCETVEQLGVLPVGEALGTLRELVTASTGFLATLSQVIKREQFIAEEKAAQASRPAHPAKASFLKIWWESLRPHALASVKVDKLEGIITETEALLMDGEFSARFNRYMVQTMTPSAPAPAPAKTATTPPMPAVQSDAELRALKAKLQAELEEVAKLKAGLAARERTLRDGEQKLRENEQAFVEKCKREQAALDEAKAVLAARDAEIDVKARQAAEKQAEELAQLEGVKAELAARNVFIEESEQRLLMKGQEQIEHLAELEQKEDELMATKRELNGMRKELGLPLIPLRAKPVDEFEE
ncbi:hypothetical protein RAHE111665_07655 [Rariglobus hedericola]